jgi:glycosyltransferase involved in cell wall biosynthesis
MARHPSFPRVSIVTPSYNQGEFLERAIRSVLHQDYPNLEYIVIDGGSSDESVDIIKNYSNSLAFWESKKDLGQSHAINKGWRRSTGKYLWWLNSDDVLTPGSIAKSANFLEDNPDVDMVYGDLYFIDGMDRRLRREYYLDFDLVDFLVHYRKVSQPGALMRRENLDAVGYLDEELHYIMDRDFWVRLALSGRQIVHIPEVLAMLRFHSTSKAHLGSPEAVEERYQHIERVLHHPSLPDVVLLEEKQLWSNIHLQNARILMKCGEYHQALNEIRLTINRNLTQIFRPSLWTTIILSGVGSILGYNKTQGIRRSIRQIRGLLRLA